jgi:hypothetical protein
VIILLTAPHNHHALSVKALKPGEEKNFRADLTTVFRHSQDPRGLIINCKDMPQIKVHLTPKDVSTDFIAFYATVDEPFCEREFPSSASFCKVSLKHAEEAFQFSPYGTYMSCKVGNFACLLAWKKDLSTVGNFLPNDLGEWLPDDSWDTEIVLATANSTLYVTTWYLELEK